MRKSAIFLACGVIVLLLLTLIKPVFAGDLEYVTVQLDRTAASSPLSGFICARPSAAGAGTENAVTIAFPPSFVISSTNGNWTSGTSNLPSGSTAWPGIGSSASSVNGNSVTFSSSDLTSSSTTYCFRFSSPTSNTGTTTGTVHGTLTTKNGAATIDSKGYGLTVGNDQLTVTASVGAKTTDFQAELKTPHEDQYIGENSTMLFELTYGSYLPYPSDITIEAEWSLGRPDESSTPTVEIINYEPGSATDAWFSSPPVIDPVNRRITWTIDNFPANTFDKQVKFTLRTTEAYKGVNPVHFSVKGRLLGPGTQTADSTVDKSYKYGYRAPSSSTGPTSTLTPTPAPLITPTPVVPAFYIQTVDIKTIRDTSATAGIRLSKPSTVTVQYGQSPGRLTESITSLTSQRSHEITFAPLIPNTPYYFRIIARDESGRVLRSDIYTFSSAEVSLAPEADTRTLIVTSEKNIIFSPAFLNLLGGRSAVILPTTTEFNFQFSLDKHQDVKRMQTLLRPDTVLGFSTVMKVEASSSMVELIEIKPGIYNGKLMTDVRPGSYDLIVRIYDYSGNIVEQKLADIKVVRPLTVLAKSSENPIENARISLSLYDEKNRIFVPLSGQQLELKLPLRTDTNGEFRQVLPPGKYRAEILAIGYKEQTIDFTLGPDKDEDYPIIYVESSGFSMTNTIRYYTTASWDFLTSFDEYLSNLLNSMRFFHLVSAGVILTFVILTLVSFAAKIHLPVRHLPHYIIHHGKSLHPRNSSLQGRVIDAESDAPLANAHLIFTDASTHTVIGTGETNINGLFSCPSVPGALVVTCIRKGYLPLSHIVRPMTDTSLLYGLMRHEPIMSLVEKIKHVFFSLMERSFEGLLVVTVILELLMGMSFGWTLTLPFLLLSLLNLYLFVHHELKTGISTDQVKIFTD